MPNQPAPIAIFAGRLDEIEALENGLYQTKMGYSSNYLITGERGIGKSSLLTYIKSIASGEVESPDYEKFTGEENILTNALHALRKRNIILKNASKRGEYRLQQQGFAIWIKHFASRKKNNSVFSG